MTTLTTGLYNFDCVDIEGSAVVSISGGVTIFTQCFTLGSNATITGLGQGTPPAGGDGNPNINAGPSGGGTGEIPLGCGGGFIYGGGGHGGVGGSITYTCSSPPITIVGTGGNADDDPIHPTRMGGPGGSYDNPTSPCSWSGALLWIIVYDPSTNQVTGPAAVNGTIDMDGGAGCESPFSDGGGAGGTILIEASSITGSGALSANGGNISGLGAHGGGGIISLIGTTSGFTGTTSVSGGGNGSYSGGDGLMTITSPPSSGY